MNIVIVGYRGSGKTAVGRAVAQRLGRPFVDTDALIEERAGRAIAEIFANDGELAFRQREAVVVREVAAVGGQVISVGGGAVLSAANVDALRAGGRTVWLDAPAETLWERIRADDNTGTNRPDLTATGGLEEVRTLLAQRKPLYRSAADEVVETADRSVEAIADEVVALCAGQYRET